MKNKILVLVIIVSIISIIVILGKRLTNEALKETDAACFEFNKEEGEITGYLDICSMEVVIPEKIEGVTVTKIKNFAFNKKGLTKVVIPKTVKEIGSGAFSDNEIKVLKLNDGLELIKPYAFSNNKIEKLTIPSTVKEIRREAFNGNSLRTKDAFIYHRDENGKEDKTILIGYGGKEKNVKIPEGVETIYLNALSNNNIKSIELPNSIERLEYSSLSGNEIEEIIIPGSVMHLGEDLLSNNPIKKIVIEGKKSLDEFNYVGENWNSGCENIIYK